jgi:thiamine kinase-like enzyme
MKDASAKGRVADLAIWRGPVDPQPLNGGMTNVNFLVEDDGERFVVRVGNDIPIHQVMRFNDCAASQAAYLAGISPEVVHSEPGILVIRYVEGRTCRAEDIREPDRLARIVTLIKCMHREMPQHLRGPVLAFWVFHVIRDYAHTLARGKSRFASRLAGFVETAKELEEAVGPVDLVFGHNDLLPGNFIDDGKRIWLIDWDYAGFNTPLFDLANLASNSDLDDEQEAWMLEAYFGHPPEKQRLSSYRAMKCASYLRDAMWSMVCEIHPESANYTDKAAYTDNSLERYSRAQAAFDGKKSSL